VSQLDPIFSPDFDNLLKDYLVETKEATKATLRNKIVTHCLPYVQKIARGLARRGADPVDDLTQVGCMGLIKALDKFNPFAGTQFKTYATYLITGEIRHYLRDKSAIIKAPRQMYELYYRMNQIIQRLTEELGRTPTDLEIAEELECPLHTVQDAGSIDRRRTLVSLDQFVTNRDGHGEAQYIEHLVDSKYYEFLRNQETRILLDRAMKHLKDELKVVIQMTYYEDMSQMEIAAVLGISQMQVSRRLRKALDILHNTLHGEHLGAS
jgi:RNA polymerase sigma-B factor